MNLNKLKKGIVLLVSYPLYPISLLFPSKKERWLFGSFGKFNDNSRYLFEHCANNEKNIKPYWVAKNKEEFDLVQSKGYPVIYKYSLKGLMYLLSSKVYIYSSYVSNISYFTSGNKVLVNLWHGIPLKKIEFDITTPPLNSYFRNANLWMKCLYPQYHKRENLLLCPSEKLYNDIFKTAFKASKNNIIEANYPRVSFLEKIKEDRENKVKKVTYTPTWRDNNPNFIEDKIGLFNKINKLAKEKNFQFNIKLHPNSNFKESFFTNFENINLIDNQIDPIELLQDTDCLITDYSSIYLDYLILDRPIIFFQYDKDNYLKNRELYNSDVNILPGDICTSDIELINILSSDFNKDTHRNNRRILLKLITSSNGNKYIVNRIKEAIV